MVGKMRLMGVLSRTGREVFGRDTGKFHGQDI